MSYFYIHFHQWHLPLVGGLGEQSPMGARNEGLMQVLDINWGLFISDSYNGLQFSSQ